MSKSYLGQIKLLKHGTITLKNVVLKCKQLSGELKLTVTDGMAFQHTFIVHTQWNSPRTKLEWRAYSRPTTLGDLAVILAASLLPRDAIARLEIKSIFSVAVLCSVVLQNGYVRSGGVFEGRSRIPSVCCHSARHHGRHQKDLEGDEINIICKGAHDMKGCWCDSLSVLNIGNIFPPTHVSVLRPSMWSMWDTIRNYI